MCLSTVYLLENQQRKELCNNIMSITFEDNKIVCANILGVRTVIEGVIGKIDLMDNYIEVIPRKD